MNIKGKKCVVVGGGEVAFRKIKMLLDCGAKVTVISPVLHQDLMPLVGSGNISLIKRTYEPGDLEGATMVVAATNEEKINKKVSNEAKKRGIIVNVADNPEESDYIVPSFFRRGDLTIAVSTAGKSPALAKKIRMKLEQDFGVEFASLLSLIGEVRSEIKKKGLILDGETWQKALDLDGLIRLIQTNQRERAKAVLLNKLKTYQERSGNPR